ncbi:hypothetical protein G7Y89_g9142 [Cudoniella acicularis]|uniref:Uncharacterized protein n=1 Tax=Cudoniella acicularis TaxID=354080 RepID=A0A8H4RF71_9HELO|nr:hypothetical protein G7Y89_g9142 [Cudoniella acicularis]
MSYTLLLLPRNMVVDGEASYLSQVAALEELWDTIPGHKGSPYPFSFSPEERQEMDAYTKGALLGMDVMRSIQESIGNLFPEQGCVRTELYEEALNALGQMKEQRYGIDIVYECENPVAENRTASLLLQWNCRRDPLHPVPHDPKGDLLKETQRRSGWVEDREETSEEVVVGRRDGVEKQRRDEAKEKAVAAAAAEKEKERKKKKAKEACRHREARKHEEGQ